MLEQYWSKGKSVSDARHFWLTSKDVVVIRKALRLNMRYPRSVRNWKMRWGQYTKVRTACKLPY